MTEDITRNNDILEDAERSVLGAMIISKDAAKSMSDRLTASVFFYEKHQHIFDAIVKLVKKHKDVNLVTVCNQLNIAKKLTEAGGRTFVADILDTTPTAENVDAYADIVEKHSKERKLKHILSRSINSDVDVDTEISSLKKELNSLETPDKKLIDELDEAKEACFEKVEEEFKSSTEKTIKTGFKIIDKHMYFRQGDFNVVQAMSNHGKTRFMLNLLYNILNQNNTTCVFITYESSANKIRQNFINIISKDKENRPLLDRKYNKSTNEWEYETYPNKGRATIDCYNKMISENRLLIMGEQNVNNLEKIITSCKKNHPENTIVIFLDYFQIITDNFKSESWERIKERAYLIERIAIDQQVVIFTGSQVNDKGETREGKDLYNSATNVLHIFNHSHDKVSGHDKLKSKYVEKIGGSSVISITVDKSKDFSSTSFEKRFSFNGYLFKENPPAHTENQEKITDLKQPTPEYVS